MLIRSIKTIQISLSISILLVIHYLYSGILPQMAQIAVLMGAGTFLLIPLLYFTIGHWEGIFLTLLGIGFHNLYLVSSLSEFESTVFIIRILLIVIQISFLIQYIKLTFRKSLLTDLLGSSPHKVTILFGFLITGTVGYCALEFVPESGLAGHFESIAWFVYSLIVCITIVPFIAEVLVHQRMQKKGYPYTFKIILRTLLAYFLFITGCVLLSALGFVLFFLLSWLKDDSKRKLFYHKTIKAFCRILILATTRGLKIVDKNSNSFGSPAVIIANHQSFIDLIVIQSLHHKMILLTNDWVWNSPLFGVIARWANYYPVSSGIEKSLGNLRELVDKGYSIAVFPEGSRSKDKTIKRFKKGAFYLAEKLDLDILPVVFHGTGEGIAKKEFALKKTSLTALILPKIKPENGLSVVGYSERSKQISRMFKNEYNNLKQDCETPEFLGKRLLLTYAYQGYPPLQAIRKTIKNNKKLLSCLFSTSFQVGIVHLGCNYGELTCLLNQKHPDLTAIGLEKNKAKLDVARSVVEGDKNRNLHFLEINTQLSIDHEFDLCLVNLDGIEMGTEQSRALIANLNELLVAGGSMVMYKEGSADLALVDNYSNILGQGIYQQIPSDQSQALIFTKQHETV